MWVPGWSSSPLQEWEALALHRWVVSVALVITESDSIFDKFRSLRFILPIICGFVIIIRVCDIYSVAVGKMRSVLQDLGA